MSEEKAESKKPTECELPHLYLARYALSRVQTALPDKTHLYEPFFRDSGLGKNALKQYHITLRRLRDGCVYLLLDGELHEYAVGKSWSIKLPRPITKETQAFIAYSPEAWAEGGPIRKQAQDAPEQWMQKIVLTPKDKTAFEKNDYVEPMAKGLLETLVEEAMAAPHYCAGIRSFPDVATAVCLDEEGLVQETFSVNGDELLLRNRWRETGNVLRPLEESWKDGQAALVALHDPIGMGLELGKLHSYSAGTITAHAAWYGYGVTVAETLKYITEKEPERREDLKDTEQRENVFMAFEKLQPVLHANKEAYCQFIQECERKMRKEPTLYYLLAKNMQAHGYPYLQFSLMRIENGTRDMIPASGGTDNLHTLLYKLAKPKPLYGDGYGTSLSMPVHTEIMYHAGAFTFASLAIPKNAQNNDAVRLGKGYENLLADYAKEDDLLHAALSLFMQDWKAWLCTTGTFGFCKAFRIYDVQIPDLLTEKEEVYANCHTHMTALGAGMQLGSELYFPPDNSSGSPWQQLFWEVVEATGAPEPLKVSEGFSNLVDNMFGVLGAARSNKGAEPVLFLRLLEAVDKRTANAPSAPPAGTSVPIGGPGNAYNSLALEIREQISLISHESPTLLALDTEEGVLDTISPFVGMAQDTSNAILERLGKEDAQYPIERRIIAKTKAVITSQFSGEAIGRTLHGLSRVIIVVHLLTVCNDMKDKDRRLAAGAQLLSLVGPNLVGTGLRNMPRFHRLLFSSLRNMAVTFPLARRFIGRALGPLADAVTFFSYLNNREFTSASIQGSGAVVAMVLAYSNPYTALLVLLTSGFLASSFEKDKLQRWLMDSVWGARYSGAINKEKGPKRSAYPLFSYAQLFKEKKENEHPQLPDALKPEMDEDHKERVEMACVTHMDAWVLNQRYVYVFFSASYFLYSQSRIKTQFSLMAGSMGETKLPQEAELVPWAPRLDSATGILYFEAIYDKQKLLSMLQAKYKSLYQATLGCAVKFTVDDGIHFSHYVQASLINSSVPDLTNRRNATALSRYHKLVADYGIPGVPNPQEEAEAEVRRRWEEAQRTYHWPLGGPPNWPSGW